jgi:hypothetical protein
MSIKIIDSVWEHSQHQGSALLMLLAIADIADEYGEAYPGVQRLADKTRMSVRNAQLVLNKLLESGELVIDYQNGVETGNGKTNRYRIMTPGALSREGVKPPSPVKYEGVKSDAQRGEIQCSEGVKPPSPKPSVNRQLNRQDTEVADASPIQESPKTKKVKDRDPTLDHPSVTAYRDHCKRTPNVQQRQAIIERVGNAPAAVERWADACRRWVLRSYNPGNLDGLLDFFATSPAVGGTPPPAAQPTDDETPALERTAEMVDLPPMHDFWASQYDKDDADLFGGT